MTRVKQVDKVVGIFKSITRFPTPSVAEIFRKDTNGFSVLSKWSQDNYEAGKRVSQHQIYTVNNGRVTSYPAIETNELNYSLISCHKYLIFLSIPDFSAQFLLAVHTKQLSKKEFQQLQRRQQSSNF